MSQDTNRHASIRRYLFNTETMPVDEMKTADLIVGEAYVEAMISLMDQLKDDAESWAAVEREGAEDIGEIPVDKVNQMATDWQASLKTRLREARKELESRVKDGKQMPPLHALSHTVIESNRGK